MKKWNRIFGIAALAAAAGALAIAQGTGPVQIEQLREQLRAAQDAADTTRSSAIEQSLKAAEQALRGIDMNQIQDAMRTAQQAAAQTIDMDQVREAMRDAQQSMKSIDMDQVREQMRDAQAVMPVLDSAEVQESLRAAERAMQDIDWSQIDKSMKASQKAMDKVDLSQLDKSMKAVDKAWKSEDALRKLDELQFAPPQLDRSFSLMADAFGAGSSWGGALAQVAPGLAFQQNDAAERAREARERAQEQRERARESIERAADNEQHKIELYRDGTGSIDDGRYERAVSSFNRLLETDSKWPRADGAYYFKAYALNKLGKRDEALAALAEIPKQFPQSKWINDAKALQVEIQQAQGRPVSPNDIDDQDLKLIALNALMNSDSERAVPLVDKVLSDPKNNVQLKAKALYILAQRGNGPGRDIVMNYAKSGSNPDLQIRAIGYIGAFRTDKGMQVLGEVYAANNDVAVRRAVLRAMANSRDSAHLISAAKSEQNADLRREAIRDLGNMQAANELAQMYATETNADLKAAILGSLMNARGAEKLIEIAKSEKNPELRSDAIRYMANMRGDKSADALASMYSSESDKNVKEQIIRSLGQESAGKQLVEVVRSEKDTELKKDGILWLGRMRNSKEATDYLAELLSK